MSITHITTTDGLSWTLDTDDWSDQPSREIAERALRGGLAELPAEARRQLHADLLAWQADGGETLAVPALHDELSARAWRAGTAGWARQPDSGHNVEIRAENAI